MSLTNYELREVQLSAKPQAMLEASPKGTVPVLVLPNAKVIDESLDIMRWALERNDPEGWLGGSDTGLIALNDGPFKRHLDRYKYPDRFGADPLEHRQLAVDFLQVLEDRLERAGHLCGPGRTMTDAAIVPFVRQFAAVDSGWFASQPLEYLKIWLAKHLSS